MLFILVFCVFLTKVLQLQQSTNNLMIQILILVPVGRQRPPVVTRRHIGVYLLFGFHIVQTSDKQNQYSISFLFKNNNCTLSL